MQITVVLLAAPLDASDTSQIETTDIARINASQPVTHFADMALGSNGTAILAWTKPERGIQMAREPQGGGEQTTPEVTRP